MPELVDRFGENRESPDEQRKRKAEPCKHQPARRHLKRVLGQVDPADEVEEQGQEHEGHCRSRCLEDETRHIDVDRTNIAVVE